MLWYLIPNHWDDGMAVNPRDAEFYWGSFFASYFHCPWASHTYQHHSAAVLSWEDCHTPKENWQASPLPVKRYADSWAIPPHFWTNQWWDTIHQSYSILHWTIPRYRIFLSTVTHTHPKHLKPIYHLYNRYFFLLRASIQLPESEPLVPAHLSHAFKTNPHWKKEGNL